MYKYNNKGFTLIELIIVIAIIAILSAVVTPQYLKYVERARESNDLQSASNLVEAATLAMIDPGNNITPGHYVEVIWVCGPESPDVTSDTIIVRHNDNYRVSIFNDGVGDDDLPKTDGDIENLRKFADSLFMVLAGDTSSHIDGRTAWLQVQYNEAGSELAGTANFSFHVDTSTGKVALADYPTATSSNTVNRWLELGVNAIPAP